MKRISFVIAFILSAVLASVYIYPIFSGLILLPLDLLVSNSGPWHYANTILLKNPYMVDSIIQMFPWKHLTFMSLTHGILPLWNPYQFLGVPFMAGMKPLVFYPANIFFVFGELHAWNILLWLQLFLSLGFTYLFASALGLDLMFALLAAVAFTFNSLMVSVLEFGSEGHVLLWLPVLLYLVKRYVDTDKLWFVTGITIATACAIFAGHLQYFTYVLLVVCGFIVYYSRVSQKSLNIIFLSFAGIATGVMIAGIQLVPGIEMFQKSYRGIIGSYATFSGGLLKPYHLLRLLSPDWFGNPVSLDLHAGYIESSGYFGIIPLFFMVYALWYARKNIFVRFFSVTAGIALLFSMDGVAQILYALRVPIITSGYGSRIFSMFLFSGAILSAFGLSTFIQEISVKRKIRSVVWFIGFVGICFGLGLLIAHSNSNIGVQLSNIKVQIAGIVLFGLASIGYVRYQGKFPILKLLFIVTVLVLTYGDLFRLGYRFLTFSNEKFLYPEIPITSFIRADSEKSLGRSYGLTEPEVNTALRIYGTDTYNPLFPVRTARFLQALEDKQGTKLMNNKYELTQNSRMKSVLDFLGVNIVVVPKGANPATLLWNNSQYEKDITKIFEDDRSDVYRNLTAYPRFGLFYDARDNVADDQALEIIKNQSVDFRKTLLIQERLPSKVTDGTGSAELVYSDVNSLTFNVHSDSSAIFYLSDAFDEGWHASVNGKSESILHANYNFRAVLVPAGSSSVKFWYLPTSVIIGGVVSVLGLFATLGLVIIGNIKNSYKKSK